MASRDWWMDQVHPVFWPVLWVSMEVFCHRLEQLVAEYGPDSSFSWRVHWWGWVEIVGVFPADPPEPAWLSQSKTVVTRLLSGFEAVWAALDMPCVAESCSQMPCAPTPAPEFDNTS